TDVTFTMAGGSWRCPDWALVRRERFGAPGVPIGPVPFPPDVAFEVISPNDTRPEIQSKRHEYRNNGVVQVWVDPQERTVEVIGQACEFDYSGTQACKALRTEGYEVVLVNSNPATIMTDPEFADRTYVEPLTADYLEAIIARERPDALLPTVGGQTALNLSVELAERGVLDRYNVQLIGASLAAIKMAEDR